MPTYDFECPNCSEVFEELVSFDIAKDSETNDKVTCVKCGCKKVKKLITGNFGDAGKGSFSYNAGKNMEKGKDLRRRAEAATDNPVPYAE